MKFTCELFTHIADNLLINQSNQKRNDGKEAAGSVTKPQPIKSDEILKHKISISNRSATRLIDVQMDALGTIKMTNGL